MSTHLAKKDMMYVYANKRSSSGHNAYQLFLCGQGHTTQCQTSYPSCSVQFRQSCLLSLPMNLQENHFVAFTSAGFDRKLETKHKNIFFIFDYWVPLFWGPRFWPARLVAQTTSLEAPGIHAKNPMFLWKTLWKT